MSRIIHAFALLLDRFFSQIQVESYRMQNAYTFETAIKDITGGTSSQSEPNAEHLP